MKTLGCSVFNTSRFARHPALALFCRAMLRILYSQPLRGSFCRAQNPDTEGFQLMCSLLRQSDLMRNCDVGKVSVNDFDNLIIVVAKFLKLEIKGIRLG